MRGLSEASDAAPQPFRPASPLEDISEYSDEGEDGAWHQRRAQRSYDQPKRQRVAAAPRAAAEPSRRHPPHLPARKGGGVAAAAAPPRHGGGSLARPLQAAVMEPNRAVAMPPPASQPQLFKQPHAPAGRPSGSAAAPTGRGGKTASASSGRYATLNITS